MLMLTEHREQKVTTMLYLAGNNYLVSDQRLTDADVDVLCDALTNNSYVTQLDLRYNCLTDVGAKRIAQLLAVSSSLSNPPAFFLLCLVMLLSNTESTNHSTV